ncbi:hypothetical protein BCR43DRAFT_496321 [Syncephalastrum racemosum]|uniref:RhoGAP-domain-containing protein n=1 Tax=Syncephalastrum racemosum TaxID=13706 RepID=A0A1X2H547_SYNRA|nr:hypothetical protein BCR43DRAFT_496321 [Syncephalastrum racemosum]
MTAPLSTLADDISSREIHHSDRPATHHYSHQSDATRPTSRRQSSTEDKTATLQHHCYRCAKSCIRTDRSLIQALDRIYHYRCFVCEDCHQPVTDKFYAADPDEVGDDRVIVCEIHYYVRRGLLCKQCEKPLRAGAPAETVGRFKYHEQCIKCPGCLLALHAPPSPVSQSQHHHHHFYQRRHNSHPTNGTAMTPSAVDLINKTKDKESTTSWVHHDGRSYCRYHYSLLRGTECAGCNQAIMSQPVDDMQQDGKRWHHECYMIQKYWNVRLATQDQEQHDFGLMSPDQLYQVQEAMERKRKQVWAEMGVFEDSLATCISDMALHISASAYQDGVQMASQFAWHLKVLFQAHKSVHDIYSLRNKSTAECDALSRTICDHVIQFFDFLDPTYPIKREAGFSKEVLAFVTHLAYSLKSLLRVGLSESLWLEQHGVKDAIFTFLDVFLQVKESRVCISKRYWFKEAPFPPFIPSSNADTCRHCHSLIQHACYRHGSSRWHIDCVHCDACKMKVEPKNARLGQLSPSSVLTSRAQQANTTVEEAKDPVILLCDRCLVNHKKRRSYSMQQTPLIYVTQLEQCLHLLRVALARTQLHQQQQAPKYENRKSAGETRVPHKIDTINKEPITRPQQPSPTQRNRMTTTVSDTTSELLRNVKRTRSSQLGKADFSSSPANIRRTITLHADSNITNNENVHHSTPLEQRGSKISTIRRAFSAGRRREKASLTNIFGGSTAHIAPNNRQSAPSSDSATRGKIQAEWRSQDQPQRQHAQAIASSTTLSELTATQDFIVRHIAVLEIEAYVKPQFELEDLIALVENKKASLWGKLKVHIRGGGFKSPSPPVSHLMSPSSYNASSSSDDDASSDHISQKTFGMPLTVLAAREKAERLRNAPMTPPPARAFALASVAAQQPEMMPSFSENTLVPSFVQNCILALLQSDVSVEGIFRKNGNIRELREMCEAINRLEGTDQQEAYLESLMKESPIQLAALLKRYLRDLPEPLLTFKLYKLFLTSIGMETEAKTKRVLHLACCMLPKPNRDVMHLLCLFLNWVASFKDKNRMDIQNLALIFTPTILYAPPSKDLPTARAQQQSSAQDEIQVITLLIRHQAEFCKIPAEIVPLLQDTKLTKSLCQQGAEATSTKDFLRTYTHMIKVKPSLSTQSAVVLPSSYDDTGLPIPPKSAIPAMRSQGDDLATANNKRNNRRSWIPGKR